MLATLGLDYGTNSVRALLVDVRNGAELATSVWNYEHGHQGVILDHKDPNLARQHPQDYLTGTRRVVRAVLRQAAKVRGFKAGDIIGIGVAATGSTPMPLDAQGRPLAFSKPFARNPAAMAWLWKDHTGYAEAEEITAQGLRLRPRYLAKCGGRYSAEWFWSKLWHCARVAPMVFDAADTWVEIADWIPAYLTGQTAPAQLRRGICAAGHKAMFHPTWGGYPDDAFLEGLDARLGRIRKSLPDRAYNQAAAAGGLAEDRARELGLKPGIPITIGAFDAHLGALGAGIEAGTLVKIIGTSTCDIMVAPLEQNLPDVPGLCGIVPESVRPGYFGLEAGQSAVGDIFNWFVEVVKPWAAQRGSHEALSRAAARLKPGASGLLTLDWHNGNRTVLVDQKLTGLTLGLTLHSTPAEIYRSLIEATAFGARVIMERFEEYGMPVQRVVNCGGIAAKNPLVMRIYSDIMRRPIALSRSAQTCALGAAIAAAVSAGSANGGYDDFSAAIAALTAVQRRIFNPDPARAAIYDRLYRLYRVLHDAFGVAGQKADLSTVMKDLIDIRNEVCHGL